MPGDYYRRARLSTGYRQVRRRPPSTNFRLASRTLTARSTDLQGLFRTVPVVYIEWAMRGGRGRQRGGNADLVGLEKRTFHWQQKVPRQLPRPRLSLLASTRAPKCPGLSSVSRGVED